MENKKNTALRMSLIAITTAIVAVFTIAIRIPTPLGGYVSLCDVAVTFVSYTFGPITGLIAGGLGTALADLAGGFGQWAPVSFVVHGLEALVIALIVRAKPDSLIYKIISAALAEIPANIAQAAVGVVLGLPLSMAVGRAYRKIDEIKW